jgi:hypothetical protein
MYISLSMCVNTPVVYEQKLYMYNNLKTTSVHNVREIISMLNETLISYDNNNKNTQFYNKTRATQSVVYPLV